jgi:hypothetical protein
MHNLFAPDKRPTFSHYLRVHSHGEPSQPPSLAILCDTYNDLKIHCFHKSRKGPEICLREKYGAMKLYGLF